MFFRKLNYISLEIFNDKLRERFNFWNVSIGQLFYLVNCDSFIARNESLRTLYFFRVSFLSGSFSIIHPVKK